MEANRVWHDPVVEIYSNAITLSVCCSAAAYDLANRRWYRLNIGDPAVLSDTWRYRTRLDIVPADEWLSSTVEKHIKAHYESTSALPPWNTINTNTSGSPVTFELSKERYVRRRIWERFNYGHRSSDKLPIIGFNQIREKTYLSRGADYCVWNNRRCVFKRIEFDCDVDSHKKEIRARERLIQCIESESKYDSKDYNEGIRSRFNVVPIFAVVLHDESSEWIVSPQLYEGDANIDSPEISDISDDEDFGHSGSEIVGFAADGDVEHVGSQTADIAADADHEHEDPQFVELVDIEGSDHDGPQIAGFLMPYEGPSLEMLGLTITGSGAAAPIPSTIPNIGSSPAISNIPVEEEQLLDLACGLRNFSECGLVHGDICYWNVILTQPETTFQAARLLLIDMGQLALDYKNDSYAMGDFFLWCLEHSTGLNDNVRTKRRIMTAAALLKDGDIDRAIGVLSPSKAKNSFKGLSDLLASKPREGEPDPKNWLGSWSQPV